MNKVSLTTIFFILLQLSSVAQALKRKFTYGINGHPLTQESYSGNLNLQIDLIKELNSKFYRVDLAVDSTGKVINEKKFMELITATRKNGIKLLPVLSLNRHIYDTKSMYNTYKEGIIYGTNFVKRYKAYFDYYEVGNEEDNHIILSAEVDGDKAEHYDISKPKKIMPYLRGICEAIKKEDLSAKIIINGGWVHYGFFELLKLHRVNYDIIGYHGYSEMGDMNNARKNFGNVIDTLYKKFRKSIWITEVNIRNGSLMKQDRVANEWFIRNLRFLYNNSHVGAVFIYELLDEPAFDNAKSPYNNPSEAYYGLVAWQNKYINVGRKPLFAVYKSFIQTH